MNEFEKAFAELNRRITDIDAGVDAAFARDKKQMIGIKSGLKQVSDLTRKLEVQVKTVTLAGAELEKRIRTVEMYLMRKAGMKVEDEEKPKAAPAPQASASTSAPEVIVENEDFTPDDEGPSSDYEH